MNLKPFLIQQANRLKQANIENPMLDVRVLVMHVTGLSLEDIIKNDAQITQEQANNIDKLVSKRVNCEPIAYIIGSKEFYGLEFKLNQATLIPRPDTEVLIDAVLEYIQADSAVTIADLGTGSGCILLSLLHNLPKATGIGIDIQQEAIDVAKYNAEYLGLAKRAKFAISDFSEGMRDQVDVIVSNPPYIRNDDIPHLMPSVAHYEPPVALDGGNDGLECYRQLVNVVESSLKPGGVAFFECGQGQHEQVAALFCELKNVSLLDIKHDLAGIARCVVLKKYN